MKEDGQQDFQEGKIENPRDSQNNSILSQRKFTRTAGNDNFESKYLGVAVGVLVSVILILISIILFILYNNYRLMSQGERGRLMIRVEEDKVEGRRETGRLGGRGYVGDVREEEQNTVDQNKDWSLIYQPYSNRHFSKFEKPTQLLTKYSSHSVKHSKESHLSCPDKHTNYFGKLVRDSDNRTNSSDNTGQSTEETYTG